MSITQPMWRTILRQLTWSILAGIPTVLCAGDGAILIDQNSALAGQVTQGDAAGFPVTISHSGTYRLAGNLIVPTTDTTAIQITADSVTLDLNGFSIIGPASGCPAGPATTCPGSGAGIGVQAGGDQAVGPRNIRVLNGSVHGMGLIGILLSGHSSVVEKVAVYDNAGGGMSVDGTVVDSAAAHNGSFGIIAGMVRDCTSRENAGDGILLNAGGIATGNITSLNGGSGLYVPYGTAARNTVFLNKSLGISAVCPSSIDGNTIVAGNAGALDTRETGCALANNAIRP